MAFKYAELTCFIKFESVTEMMVQKIYSGQDLHGNVMKTIQKMPCTCMQRMIQP